MNWKDILIIIVLVTVVGGLFAHEYWWKPKQELETPEIPEFVKEPVGKEEVEPEKEEPLEEEVPPKEELPEEEIIPEREVKEETTQIPEEITPKAPPQGKSLFGKEILSKPSIDSESIFMVGVTDDHGSIDWRTPLTISSIAEVSPILLIENKNSVDDFSPKLFVEQYSPSMIYLHNYNYNFPNVKKIETENINSQLYSSSNFVVISNGNDYETSLTAASFAAYFNIPIFFSPLNNNDKDLIERWNAKKIGIRAKTGIDYSLTVSEAVDIIKENSDYLILTTSDDLSKPERPGFSLSAPILTGGRKGVLLNITNPTKTSVKTKINEVTRDGFAPSYIVVVGSEKNFPFLDFEIVPPNTYFDQDDDHQYFVNLYYWANYNSSNEYIPDAAVGAITGYSVSDVSSLIARSIFYDRIAKSDKVVYWSPYSDSTSLPSGYSLIGPILDTDFHEKNINNFKSYSSLQAKSIVINELKNSSVFIYNGHAGRTALGNISISEIPVFRDPAFIFAFGCATLEPWNPGTPEEIRNEPIISYEAIKKGAVGILGAVEVSLVSQAYYYGTDQRIIVENSLNMPVGDSDFLTLRMFDASYLYGNLPPGRDVNYYNKRYIYLLGDPKLEIKASSQIQPNVFSDKARMNFAASVSERMLCYKEGTAEYELYGGACVLCKVFKKSCETMEEKPDTIVEFDFPLLLESYVYATDTSIYSQTGYGVKNTYFLRAALRFFTIDKIYDVDIIKSDGQRIDLPISFKKFGEHCFYFNNRKYCPNFLELFYGSINPITSEKSIPKYLDIILKFK